MPSPESSHRPPAPQEMRVNDPEALITAPDRASAEFAKSDAIEFGVNNFVELEAITKQYEAKDKSTETNKRSAVKKVLATLTAFWRSFRRDLRGVPRVKPTQPGRLRPVR